MSSDPFAHDAAAYVLGALSPAQRREFEEHLTGCSSCASSVNEVAGLPGLLGSLDESAFLGAEDQPPVPETLLPQLLREVRRARLRNRLVAGVGAAAALVLGVVLFGVLAGGSPDTPSQATPPAQRMAQVDQRQLSATVTLQQVAWGTKMHLKCMYEDHGWEDASPPSYALIVHSRDGGSQQVATWRAAHGEYTELDAATDLDPREIRALDVVLTQSGRRVLTLAPGDART